MPLSTDERAFLDAFVYEATNGPPYGGPATRELNDLGIWYTGLSWILTAYQRQLGSEGMPTTGICNPNPPPSPWKNLEEVQLRNQVLEKELHSQNEAVLNESRTVPTVANEEEVYEELRQLFDPDEADRIFAEQHGKGRPLAAIWQDLEANL